MVVGALPAGSVDLLLPTHVVTEHVPLLINVITEHVPLLILAAVLMLVKLTH
jgi:hypothetical protein